VSVCVGGGEGDSKQTESGVMKVMNFDMGPGGGRLVVCLNDKKVYESRDSLVELQIGVCVCCVLCVCVRARLLETLSLSLCVCVCVCVCVRVRACMRA
jgi:hypothetical protein